MTKKRSMIARKPRADALRNRERILEVAKAAFTRQGANASLDEIAKQAGVGAGTLYRHFPTRDELLASPRPCLRSKRFEPGCCCWSIT
jgi:AcrR family transcriptional regulator